MKLEPPAPPVDPAVQRAQSRVGMVLQDKWRLDALLGVGGMAAVYAATHRNSKRVAVKMLHPELCGDTQVKQRFLSEGYAANIIEHPGAVSVLDDDSAPDGSAFLVMELLDGETLEQRWERKGKRLELGEVLRLMAELLDVLAAAHAKSIVHRDIKPENLFLTRQGTLKVLDFGIAKVFESREEKSQTKAGMVMGTPAFMSPEQARARWDEVDARTDLWAVGATMFTLLSGQHVHEGRTGNEQLIFSATTPARSIATVVQGLPRSVVATIDRALAFEKEARWPSARAMQEAVKGAIESIALRGGAPSTVSMPQMPRVSIPGAVDLAPTSGPTSAPATSTQLRSQVESLLAERDARAAEVAQHKPALAAAQSKVAAAKKRTQEVQARLAAARQERQSLDQWFKRQVGTRTAAVEDARKQLRRANAELGRRALADRQAFGDELNAEREEIARLGRAADARAHDVDVHERALGAYDKQRFKQGVVLAAIGALLVLALLVTPIVLKLMPVDPSTLPPLPPAPAQPAP